MGLLCHKCTVSRQKPETTVSFTDLLSASSRLCLVMTMQTHYSLTSMACRKSWGISERSHWFQGLSLSTSSRDDGMSKSPTEEYGARENEPLFPAVHPSVMRAHLGRWNGSQNFGGAGKQTPAVFGAAKQCHVQCCCWWAGRPEPAPWTQHPLWSKYIKTGFNDEDAIFFLKAIYVSLCSCT